jgi:hypothetical protein
MTDVNPTGSSSAGSGSTSSTSSSTDTWFEAIARAWGSALDSEAQKLTDLSNQINGGGADQPSLETMLSAESQRMGFLANAESNSINSIGSALQTMARKQ